MFIDLSLEVDREKNTHALCWDGSQLLSRYLEQQGPEWMQGQNVLELGAGCGLPGLAAYALGARSCTLTDLPEAIGQTQFCVALNSSLADDTKNGDAHHDTKGGGSGSERVDQEHRKRGKKDRPRIRAVPYAWGADTAEIRRYGPFSLVLCADVLYSRQGAKALVQALRAVAVDPQTLVLLAYKARNLGEGIFFPLIRRRFLCERLAPSSHPKTFFGSEYEVFQLRVLSSEGVADESGHNEDYEDSNSE